MRPPAYARNVTWMLFTKMPIETPACSPAPWSTSPWCWGSATLRSAPGTSPPAAAGSLSAHRPARTAGTSISSQAAISGFGPLGHRPPVAVRQVRPQRPGPRPRAVHERAGAQDERLQPARNGVVAEATPGIGEVGRGLAVARSQPQHVGGGQAPRPRQRGELVPGGPASSRKRVRMHARRCSRSSAAYFGVRPRNMHAQTVPDPELCTRLGLAHEHGCAGDAEDLHAGGRVARAAAGRPRVAVRRAARRLPATGHRLRRAGRAARRHRRRWLRRRSDRGRRDLRAALRLSRRVRARGRRAHARQALEQPAGRLRRRLAGHVPGERAAQRAAPRRHPPGDVPGGHGRDLRDAQQPAPGRRRGRDARRARATRSSRRRADPRPPWSRTSRKSCRPGT